MRRLCNFYRVLRVSGLSGRFGFACRVFLADSLFLEALANAFGKAGPVVDEAGVNFDQARARVEHRHGIVLGHDSAHPDDREASFGLFMDVTYHFERALGQRAAAQSSVADLGHEVRRGQQPLAAGGRVRRHDTVQPVFDQHFDHFVDLFVAQVGRNFQQDRAVVVLSAAKVDQPFEQFFEVFLVLQAREVRYVRAAHVDDEVVDVFVQAAEQAQVVGRGFFVRGQRVFAEVPAQHDRMPPVVEAVAAVQPVHGARHALVVETHAVDQRVVHRQPEQPRFRVSGAARAA